MPVVVWAKNFYTLFESKRFSLLCCLCIIGGLFQKSSQMFLINSASDCQVMNKIQMINPFLAFNLIFFNINIFTNNIIQMAKIGLWIFSGGLLIFGIVGGICCCLQVNWKDGSWEIINNCLHLIIIKFYICFLAGQEDVKVIILESCR